MKPKAEIDAFVPPYEEVALFCIHGECEVVVDKMKYILTLYDVLYLPRNTKYNLKNTGETELEIGVAHAPSKIDSKVVISYFKKVAKDKTGKRLRKLKGKDVYIMIGEDVEASNLLVGYSIFKPHARSWPIHKHEDQEEIYIFIKGRGAIEVFESEETKTFVREVQPGDIVPIPFKNYHPVFSFDTELHFIWIIAGERYWVGDKDKKFMRVAKR